MRADAILMRNAGLWATERVEQVAVIVGKGTLEAVRPTTDTPEKVLGACGRMIEQW